MQLYFGTTRIIGLKRANAVRLPQMSCIIKSSQYNFLKTIKWVIIFSINFLGIIDGAIVRSVFSPRENRAIHIPSVSGCSFLHHERKKEKKKADVNFSGKMGEKLTRKPSHITHTEEGCGVLCVASHH